MQIFYSDDDRTDRKIVILGILANLFYSYRSHFTTLKSTIIFSAPPLQTIFFWLPPPFKAKFFQMAPPQIPPAPPISQNMNHP